MRCFHGDQKGEDEFAQQFIALDARERILALDTSVRLQRVDFNWALSA